MQRDPDPILGVSGSAFRVPGVPNTQHATRNTEPSGTASGGTLLLTSAARDYICLHRPDLASDFEILGNQARIPITSLLRPVPGQFVPGSGFRVPGSTNSEPRTHNPEPTPGLGDFVAALLHRLGIRAAIALLQRRRLLRGCQCAARQARLNALTPRLRGLLEPWPLTLAVLLSWLLFAITLLAR
jgi:hypothetical protein